MSQTVKQFEKHLHHLTYEELDEIEKALETLLKSGIFNDFGLALPLTMVSHTKIEKCFKAINETNKTKGAKDNV